MLISTKQKQAKYRLHQAALARAHACADTMNKKQQHRTDMFHCTRRNTSHY